MLFLGGPLRGSAAPSFGLRIFHRGTRSLHKGAPCKNSIAPCGVRIRESTGNPYPYPPHKQKHKARCKNWPSMVRALGCVSLPRSRRDEAGQSPEPLRDSGKDQTLGFLREPAFRNNAEPISLPSSLSLQVSHSLHFRMERRAPRDVRANGAHTSRRSTNTSSLADCSRDTACDRNAFHWRHVGACCCPCVLIDVGVNLGGSLTAWPHTLARMHAKDEARRPALRRLKACAASATTCYYGFEANPLFDKQLQLVEHNARAEGRRVKIFTSTAFNVHNGSAAFFVQQDNHSIPAADAHFSRNIGGLHSRFFHWGPGSTLDAAKVGPTRALRARNKSFPNFREVTVRSVDASHFLASVLASEGTQIVAAKLDIENFEYTLLPHLLLSNARSHICGLDLLAVEWHKHRTKYIEDSAHLSWLLEHHLCNVTLLPWK
jgi:hypothetical protein